MRLSLRTSTADAGARAVASEETLVVQDLRARYGTQVALDGVSLDVRRGEIVCLLGPSGSGKSTLLRLIAGVDAPAGGRIVLDGVEVAGPGRFVEPEARRVGMVFQDFALFPHLTVADNVAFGLKDRRRAEARDLVRGMLTRLGLERYANSHPHMLSGGERQRVALARAMAPGPRVLLMDEPFSSLDARLRDEVRRYTLAFLRETETTTVVVTHDPDEAMRLGDRIALLHSGQLVQYGTPDEIYSHPASLCAARLLGDINVFCGQCSHGRVDTPLGRFPAGHLPEGTSAQVCVRPEHLRIATHPTAAHGRVLDRTALGEIDLLSLAVPGVEMPITLRAFGRTGLRPGDRVPIEVLPERCTVLPQDTPPSPIS